MYAHIHCIHAHSLYMGTRLTCTETHAHVSTHTCMYGYMHTHAHTHIPIHIKYIMHTFYISQIIMYIGDHALLHLMNSSVYNSISVQIQHM